MYYQEVVAHMYEAFERMVQDRVLEEDELDKMCKLVMFGLDAGKDGPIGINEYIAACASNEVLHMSDVVKFFDDERRRNIMERIFDDTVLETTKDYDPEAIHPDALQDVDEETR